MNKSQKNITISSFFRVSNNNFLKPIKIEKYNAKVDDKFKGGSIIKFMENSNVATGMPKVKYDRKLFNVKRLQVQRENPSTFHVYASVHSNG